MFLVGCVKLFSCFAFLILLCPNADVICSSGDNGCAPELKESKCKTGLKDDFKENKTSAKDESPQREMSVLPDTLRIQNFDGTTPEWNYICDTDTFDNGSNGQFGVFALNNVNGSYNNTSFNSKILTVNDLDDEGDNGTAGFAKIQFATLNLSNATDVQFHFDYEIQGFEDSDKVKYELFYDNGQGQGTVYLPKDSIGVVDISVPDSVDAFSFKLSIKQNGTNDYAGFDNFKLTGNGSVSLGNSPPLISSISQDPAAVNITSSDAVAVEADIIDDDGINTASLKWGTTPGNLANTIQMNQTTGDHYTTTSSIPAQSDGTTVYYRVSATDTGQSPVTITSQQESYQVTDPLPPADIVITEIMPDPDAVIDGEGEYFEVYNRTAQDVDMNGWTIEDNGEESNTINATLIVPSHGFSVIGKNKTASENGRIKVDYAISGMQFNLANSDDEIILFDGAGEEVDRVEYISGNGWPTITSGASLYFTGTADENNNDGNTWAVAENSLGIESDLGSPGFSGEAVLPETYYYTALYSENPEWKPADPSGETSTENIIRVDSAQAELTANTSVYNIRVEAQAELKNQYLVKVFNYIKSFGKFTFVSDSNRTGEIGILPDTARVEGRIEVQRYFSAGRAYRYVSSPVSTTGTINENWQEGVHNTAFNYGNSPNDPDPNVNMNPNPGYGTHITGSTDGNNGFDATETGNSSLYKFDNQNEVFLPVTNTDVNTIDAAEPYVMVVRGSRDVNLNFSNANQVSDTTVLRTRGHLTTGDTLITDLNTTPDKFNLVGNPYQSAVDIDSVLANANTTDVNTGQYHLFDPNLGDFGSYVTIDLQTGENLSNSVADEFLQPFQAFMIKSTGTNPAIQFSETDKAPEHPRATFNQAESLSDYPHIFGRLYTTERYEADSTMQVSTGVLFDQAFSNDVHDNDAMMPQNFGENLGAVNDGTYLSLERRSLPESGDVIPLFINQCHHENYTLIFNVKDIPETVKPVFKDSYTEQHHTLESGNNRFDFSVNQELEDASSADDRFSIYFLPTALNTPENDRQSLMLYPNPVKNGEPIILQSQKYNGKEAEIYIESLRGARVFQTTTTLSKHRLIQPGNIASGVYIVRIEGKEFSMQRKLIVD